METMTNGTATLAKPKGETPAGGGAVGSEKVVASAQLRGEVMAFALQSAFWGLGGNVIEPLINSKVQQSYAKPDDATHKRTYGTYGQNFAGELAGDVIGAATLMSAELICPDQFHRASRRFRKMVDPLYEGVAHRVFAKDVAAPDYAQKVEEWKTFQERNLVRSLIVGAGSVAGNIATQKYLVGNPSPTGVIFAGKMLSASVTTVIGLCMRMAFPKQLREEDERLSKRFFAPMLSDRNMPDAAAQDENISAHAERLRQKTDAYMDEMGR